MGSDHAPHVEIDGALAATRDFGVKVILVGQAHKVEPELRRCGWRGDGDRGIEFVEAAEVIAMDDPVAASVRRKKKSSLRIGSKLVSEGRGDGFVSAGNTGAAMATAKMVIGAIPGVDRPALAAMIPGATQGTTPDDEKITITRATPFTVEVRISGLAPQGTATIDAKDVSDTKVKVRLEVPADTPLGAYPVRLASPNGLSKKRSAPAWQMFVNLCQTGVGRPGIGAPPSGPSCCA